MIAMGSEMINGSKMQEAVQKQQGGQYTTEGGFVVPIGTTETGTVVYKDLSKIPHVLVCGCSGSGKTSFVQSVMTYLAVHSDRTEAQFVIFDSRSIDYAIFNSLPHLYAAIATRTETGRSILSYLAIMIQDRLKLLANALSKDIDAYNRKNDYQQTMPHIFFIIDDYSAIASDDPSVMDFILRNGRPVGIHLIVVTSALTAKSLPKNIVSAFPSRAVFCVTNKTESKYILDQYGAETLNIPGEMIFKWQSQMIKCHATSFSDEDMAKAIKTLSSQAGKDLNAFGEMAAKIFDEKPDNNLSQTSYIDGAYDEMLPQAADVVLEMGQCSVSMLQRRLKLGYSRAARIVEQMEELGIVGPYEGAKPRSVIRDRQEVNRIIREAGFESLEHTGYSQYEQPKEEFHGYTKDISSEQDTKGSNEPIEDDDPDIFMRDFAKFFVGQNAMCVEHNLIKLEIKVQLRAGSGTIYPKFNGKYVSELIYKRPRLFSNGYIQFLMKPDVEVSCIKPKLLSVTKDNYSEYFKIEFGSSEAKLVKRFMTQISEDIEIPITLS